MNYPGRIIRKGEPDQAIVWQIRSALKKRGYKVDDAAVAFDAKLVSTVKLFQDQNIDVEGRPLKADGQIGPLSWAALFGAVTTKSSAGNLAAAGLAVAQTQIGVTEKPLGSNSGPEVDAYLKSVGLSGGYYWCMAFVFWCFDKAAKDAGVANPFPRTAGCISAWNKVKATAPGRLITRAQAVASPALIKPGLVFILDYGGGAGHTGFVLRASGGAFRTIEGNTNQLGSGNGLGVFELNRRSVMQANLRGFIDLTATPT